MQCIKLMQRSAAGIKSDITGMKEHGLSESFSHCASQLDKIIRVKLDQKHTLNHENHKPLGKQYEYIRRTDANIHRRYINTR